MAIVDPPWVFVTVTCPVLVAPVVMVLVTSETLLAALSAFAIADSGIGAPAISQATCTGARRRSTSRLLSQLLCMHATVSGRKFPADALHRHTISVIAQLLSGDSSIHC
jgi:hypothetical protein